MQAAAQTPPNRMEIRDYKGLLSAVIRRELQETRQLLAAGADPSTADAAGRTALIVAAHYGLADIARALVKAGANPTAKDKQRYDILTIAAVNDDPPFHVYNLSETPLRVRHGGKPLPVVIVLRPDGLIGADQSYEAALLCRGDAPLTIDLSYGVDDPQRVLAPTVNIEKAVPCVAGVDGTTRYRWDVSGLAVGDYFLRGAVRSPNGSSYSDSRYSLSVAHRPLDAAITDHDDASSAPDLRRLDDGGSIPPSRGCGCVLGARHTSDDRRRWIDLGLVFIALCSGLGVALCSGLGVPLHARRPGRRYSSRPSARFSKRV